jgi:hypothetical protein
MQRVLGLALSLALAAPASRTEAQAPGSVSQIHRRDSGSAARDAYRRAFQLMVEHRWSEAAAAFREVVARFPGTREAELSAEMLQLASSLTLHEPVLGESRGPSIDRSGRAELAVDATLFGLWTGIALSIIGELDRASLLVTSATAGLGLGASLWLTRQGRITSGAASLVGTGIMFGTFDGALVAALANLETKPALGVTLGAGAAGLLAGAVVGSQTDVTSGSVALATAGGYLGTFLAGMALYAFDVGGRVPAAAALLAGANVGLLGGGVWASQVRVSRGRVLLCELGGLLGGLAAGGVVALAAHDGTRREPIAAALTAGVLAGTGLAIHLTRNFDAKEDEAHPAVSLALPTPIVLAAARRGPPALGLGVLQGTF